MNHTTQPHRADQPPPINACRAGHHFTTSTCDLCPEPVTATYPGRPGDCISCSAFCPSNAYACDHPAPLTPTAKH